MDKNIYLRELDTEANGHWGKCALVQMGTKANGLLGKGVPKFLNPPVPISPQLLAKGAAGKMGAWGKWTFWGKDYSKCPKGVL